MIITCNLNNKVTADLKLAIVRSYKRNIPGWIYYPALSPSRKLFYRYLRWKKAGLWPQKWPEYEKIFLKEMEQQQDALTQVAKWNQNQVVALGCYCKNEMFCHRILVARLINRF